MVLLLNNDEVESLLTMDNVMQALDEAYFANGGHGWGLDGGPGYGIQFTAVAKLVYDLAKDRGMGRELPLEWFQQNVRS